MKCPICGRAEMLNAGAANLPQSSNTVLPGQMLACPECPTTVTLPTGQRWTADPAISRAEARS